MARATVNKANNPRKTPSLTRNGRIRLKGFTLLQLVELKEKASTKRSAGKLHNRILVLEKRVRKLAA
jgi:hypothetical protein